MAANPKYLISPEEYLELERKAEFKSEYFDGIIFAMAGATRTHNLIATQTSAELVFQLKGKKCEVYGSDMKVRSTRKRFHYPDVSVVCGEVKFHDKRKDVYLNPTVIIEVLSDSTAAYDKGDKFLSYQLIESLQEYVLISQDKPLVEKYVRQPDENWLYSKVEGLKANIVLSSIKCRLRLADIYAKVF